MENSESTPIKSEDKILSILCHLAYLTVVGPVLIPLVVWLLKKEESPWLGANAKQALVYQGATAIGGLIFGFVVMPILGLVTFGIGPVLLIPVMLLLPVALMIPSILAAIANWNGKPYTYPVVGGLADKF